MRLEGPPPTSDSESSTGLDGDGIPVDAVSRLVLRALSQRGAHIQVGATAASLIGNQKGQFAAVKAIDLERLADLMGQGWLTAVEESKILLSSTGRVIVRRMHDNGSSATASGMIAGPARRTQASPRVDPDSPLAWLRRRRHKDGSPMLSSEAYQAGERLRADFHRGQMAPRVTADYSAVPSSGRRGAPGFGVDLGEGTSAARERVRRGLTAVGPRLANVLVDVCCHMKGLEDIERAHGMPQRAGHYVLGLALDALARHYGLLPLADTHWPNTYRTRHWGTADYKPGIDGAP